MNRDELAKHLHEIKKLEEVSDKIDDILQTKNDSTEPKLFELEDERSEILRELLTNWWLPK